jgi:hypothetical protein
VSQAATAASTENQPFSAAERTLISEQLISI